MITRNLKTLLFAFGLTCTSTAVWAEDEIEQASGEEHLDVSVVNESAELMLRAPSVSCSKNVRRTWGSITCTTSGGAYTIKEVRFDCAWEDDRVINNITVNGSWTTSHECSHKLTRIQVTI